MESAGATLLRGATTSTLDPAIADDLDATPVLDPVSTVVLQMDRRHADTVYRAGRTVVRDGTLVDDPGELVKNLQTIAHRIGPVPRSTVSAPW